MRTCRTRVVPSQTRRRGATVVEGAIVIGVFLVVLFGILDLGFAVLHHNSLSEAARRLAREAIVHGEDATPEQTAWGPTAVSGTASDGSEYSASLVPELVTFRRENVHFSLEWLDAANRPNDRVRVTVTYGYEPMIPFVLGKSAIPLRAVTTMRIAH